MFLEDDLNDMIVYYLIYEIVVIYKKFIFV